MTRTSDRWVVEEGSFFLVDLVTQASLNQLELKSQYLDIYIYLRWQFGYFLFFGFWCELLWNFFASRPRSPLQILHLTFQCPLNTLQSHKPPSKGQKRSPKGILMFYIMTLTLLHPFCAIPACSPSTSPTGRRLGGGSAFLTL